MYPGYAGSRPKMMIFHGSADTTLYPQVSQNPRSRRGNTANNRGSEEETNIQLTLPPELERNNEGMGRHLRLHLWFTTTDSCPDPELSLHQVHLRPQPGGRLRHWNWPYGSCHGCGGSCLVWYNRHRIRYYDHYVANHNSNDHENFDDTGYYHNELWWRWRMYGSSLGAVWWNRVHGVHDLRCWVHMQIFE